MSKEYINLVLLSFVISTPFAWLVTRKWLEGFAFRIHPGWGLFALAGMLCLCFTILTITYHVIKTSLSSPVTQLRTE